MHLMTDTKRILISAGDPSGDQLLSRVIREINVQNPGKYHFVGLAGPMSQREGAEILVSSKDVAVVGLVEVIRNGGKILRALKKLSDELKSCDSLLCVDFPDFNFRLARVAQKLDKPVDYIVAPQVWAWRSGRIATMQKWLRRLYPALPFEEALFREEGVDAKFLGHPIRDALPPRNRHGAREVLKIDESEFVIGILPGSRHSEIRRNLPLMIDAWTEFTKQKARWGFKKTPRGLLTIAPGWSKEEVYAQVPEKYQKKLNSLLDGEWALSFQNHASLMAADFAWITSGTASLEAAYYQLPHILVYKLNGVTVMILKSLSNYFRDPDASAGLPNILLQKRVIPELLQHHLSPKRLATETLDLLTDAHRMNILKKQLRWIPKKLGEPGVSSRVASDLLQLWG